MGTVLPTRAVGPGVLVVTENDTWHAFRAGGIVDIWLTPALKFTAEAAYARVWQKALDTHYLTFGSDPATATGNGVQLEGILSYQLTPLFNVGIGARWWHFNTTGNEAMFNQLIKYQTERYGVFVQGSLKFGDILHCKKRRCCPRLDQFEGAEEYGATILPHALATNCGLSPPNRG